MWCIFIFLSSYIHRTNSTAIMIVLDFVTEIFVLKSLQDSLNSYTNLGGSSSFLAFETASSAQNYSKGRNPLTSSNHTSFVKQCTKNLFFLNQLINFEQLLRYSDCVVNTFNVRHDGIDTALKHWIRLKMLRRHLRRCRHNNFEGIFWLCNRKIRISASPYGNYVQLFTLVIHWFRLFWVDYSKRREINIITVIII